MNFSEEFKQRVAKIDKEMNIKPELAEAIESVVVPTPRYDAIEQVVFKEPAQPSQMVERPIKVGVRRFNIHRRSLPIGVDKIVLFSLPSKEVAEKVIEKTVNRAGHQVFNTKLYINEPDQTKTYIFYEAVPEDATPEERSVFHNPSQVTKEQLEWGKEESEHGMLGSSSEWVD